MDIKFDWTRIVACLAVDWKAGVAVTGDLKGVMRAWNVSNGKLLLTIQAYKPDPSYGGAFTALVLSSDGERLYSSGREPRANTAVKVWDMKSGKQIKTLAQRNGTEYGYDRIILLNDGKQGLLFAGRVWILDLAEDKQILLKEFSSEVKFIAAADDGSRMLTASLALDLWGPKGEKMRVLQEVPNDGNRNPPVRGYMQTAGAFVPKDNTRALTAGVRGDLTFWDVEKGTMVARWSEGDPGMSIVETTIAFSADGKFALIGSEGNSLQLWEVASGKMTIALKAKKPERQKDRQRKENTFPK